MSTAFQSRTRRNPAHSTKPGTESYPDRETGTECCLPGRWTWRSWLPRKGFGPSVSGPLYPVTRDSQTVIRGGECRCETANQSGSEHDAPILSFELWLRSWRWHDERRRCAGRSRRFRAPDEHAIAVQCDFGPLGVCRLRHVERVIVGFVERRPVRFVDACREAD